MNELTVKKETESNALSLEDRKNLMSGTRTTGPTLAIASGPSGGAPPPTNTSVPPPTSFNAATGAMNNPRSDYVSGSILFSE